MDGFRIAAGALSAASTSLANTANNLANVNTPGFRARSTNFVTGANGQGVNVGSTPVDTSPGPIGFSGQPLSVALANDSFFAVRQNGGRLAFTRDGAFTVDGNGNLVTQRGDLVDPPVSVPANASGVSIGRDGTVTATLSDGSTSNLGRIEPVRFANSGGLESVGNNLLVPTPASGPGQRVAADLLPGAENLSNTDIAAEIINLIKDERFTQFNAAVIRTEDETLGTILDLKR